MQKYWRKHPPVHMLLAAYMGFKASDETPVSPEEQDNIPAQRLTQQEFQDLLKAKGLVK